MRLNLAGELRRLLVDPRSVAEALGLAEGAVRQARGITVRCPWHVERTPSCSITVGQDGTLRAHCFGCAHSGDVLDLVAQVRGLDVRREFKRVLDEAEQLAGVKLDDYRPSKGTHDRAVTKPPAPAQRPPAAEVAELWATCVAAYDDSGVSDALRARSIDPAQVTDRDLARALPRTARLPKWARLGRWSWVQLGNRLIVPTYDASGQMVSLHARRLDGAEQETPKGLSPAGFAIAGSVFADPLGRLLLSGHRVPWWASKALVVSEGVPDFLTIATHYGDADEDAPAVLGVISGSFTQAVSARVPTGCTVTIRTHHDVAGDEYAAQIARVLGRRCSLRRSTAHTRSA